MQAEVAACVTASLEAAFTPSSDGVTASIDRSPPLELRGPFREARDLPLFLLRNTTAGVFAGDRYSVRLRTDPGARVRISGTSATKVHEMPDGCAASEVTLDVATGSLLCYSPPPVILQAGSDFSQSVAVRVAAGGAAIVSDIVVPGRLASGERLAFRRFRSNLRLAMTGGADLYAEEFTLDDRAPADASLGGYSVFGVLLATGFDAKAAATDLRPRLASLRDCYSGVSALGSNVLVTKVLSRDASAASNAIAIAEAEFLRWPRLD